MAAAKYDASSIRSIREDRDRVREKPTMYTVDTHKAGAVHCVFEVVDNSIDELAIEDSVGKSLTITFDTKTKEVSVTDDGRGIPHESLFDVCTVINTSGKFDNGEDTAYRYSGGINGVGLKLAVFLSKTCEVTSMRGGKSLTYKFKDGYLVDTIKAKAKGHGTIVKFTLDDKILDVEDVEAKDIRERLKEKSYCFPDIQMTLIVIEDGKEKSTTYAGKTLMDLLKSMKPDTEIIEASGTKKVALLKRIDEDITDIKVVVQAAFGYKEAALDADTDTYVISYANSIKTYDGGAHVEGLKLGLVKFFREVLIPKFGKRDKDLPITPTDITSGLCAMVRVMLSKPEFSAQHKAKLTNQEVKFAVRDVVFETLSSLKPADVSALGDFVKRVTRGRLASKKVRKKDVDNAFSKDRPDKYTPIVYNMKTTSPELVVLEGDSAAGLAVSARDPYNQAVYMCKKPKNTFDDDSETLTQGAVNNFNEIMDICNMKPGKHCDPSQSTMQRICILADADIDGEGITVGIAGLFAKHCKPMIDAGMICRILPPLYSYTEGKKKKFIQSKRKFVEMVTSRFLNGANISYDGKAMTKKQLAEFISKNMEYDEKLQKLADYYCCEPRLMEYIVWKYHGTYKDQKKSYWMSALKKYGELKVLVENGRIVIDGELPGYDYVNLDLDERFDKRIKKFKEIQSTNSRIVGYSIGDKTDQSIYDIMRLFRSYIPKDIKYYKGLGELTPDEMAELCLDPEKRTAIVFKFKNYEEDMQKLSVILSSKAEFMDARMEVLSSITLASEDLAT